MSNIESTARRPLSTPESRAQRTDPSVSAQNRSETQERQRAVAVPFYRKRWVVIVTALAFIPVTLLILLTGPVHQGDGKVWDRKQRLIVAATLTMLMLSTLIRLSTPS